MKFEAMLLLQIEALEDKIRLEMTTLKERMSTMEQELSVYSDLDRLKVDAREKRQSLEAIRAGLQQRTGEASSALAEVQKVHDDLKVKPRCVGQEHS
jgi:intraflagellar transport protein 74